MVRYSPARIDIARRIAVHVPPCEGLPYVYADGACFRVLRAPYPYERVGIAYLHPFARGWIRDWLEQRWGYGFAIYQVRRTLMSCNPRWVVAWDDDGEREVRHYTDLDDALAWAVENAPEAT